MEEEVTEGSLANDVILEEDLKAVDAPGDEECLTYEATGGDFEWQTCGAGSTAWDDIGDPDADGTVAFAGYEQVLSSTLDEAAHAMLKLDHTDADVTTATTIFQIDSVDDADADLTYIKVVDDSGGTPTTVFSVGAHGATTAVGTIQGGTLTDGTASMTGGASVKS